MRLVELPFDVLELVCSDLDAYSAVACGRVCKVLHRVITTSLPIRFTISLAMRGMRQGSDVSISLGDRLEKLERYEGAWREGSWKKSFRMELPVPTSHVYHADGHVFIWTPEDGQVHVVRLPSPLRGVSLQECRWKFTPPASPHRGRLTVLLDIQNNIAMFVESIMARSNFSLKTILYPFELSSGNAPASIWPNTSIVLDEKRFSYTYFCLRGDFLVMSLKEADDGQGIVVYDWVKQQKLVVVRTSVSFVTFLDDTRIVAGFFRKLKPANAASYIRVFDLSVLNPHGQARATHDFMIPLRRDLSVEHGWFRIGRQCGYPATYSDAHGRADLFSDDVWAMSWFCPSIVLGKTSRENRYSLEIHLCMPELQQLVKSLPPSDDTIVVPWVSWGHAARIALTQTESAVACDVAGSRMYHVVHKTLNLRIHDYHPIRVRRARAHPSSDIFTVKHQPISDIAVLREGNSRSGFPATPRASEYVEHLVIFPTPDHPHSHYNVPVLTGDAILIREQAERYQGATNAIVAYALL